MIHCLSKTFVAAFRFSIHDCLITEKKHTKTITIVEKEVERNTVGKVKSTFGGRMLYKKGIFLMPEWLLTTLICLFLVYLFLFKTQISLFIKQFCGSITPSTDVCLRHTNYAVTWLMWTWQVHNSAFYEMGLTTVYTRV